MEKLRFGYPKQFWNYFKKKKKSVGNDVSVDDFCKYFSSLCNDVFVCNNAEANAFCQENNFDNDDCPFEELNIPITADEVLCAVKSLKKGKAAGPDFLLNEYFTESIDILCAHLCDLFNAILESGFFPDKWIEGVIVPVHKKGDTKNAQNYRGITLVSCFSKLFTTILNKRIETFCENNNVISDAQFGFRKGKSTVDAIFILHSVIQHYLNNNKRLYIGFIDLKSCFDSINRNCLWLKIYKCGIQGKILRIIKDMYEKVKSCVRSCNTYSDFFSYAVGLRQGEVISPLLFSLFVEDLELHLQSNLDSGLYFDDIVLILLLFADDMAILGKTPEDLQNSLDSLYDYCNRWGLEVNIQKTKVMDFRKLCDLQSVKISD